jgi:hypothetical protein
MVQVLDNDGSGLLTFNELCTELKKLVRPWKFPMESAWDLGCAALVSLFKLNYHICSAREII